MIKIFWVLVSHISHHEVHTCSIELVFLVLQVVIWVFHQTFPLYMISMQGLSLHLKILNEVMLIHVLLFQVPFCSPPMKRMADSFLSTSITYLVEIWLESLKNTYSKISNMIKSWLKVDLMIMIKSRSIKSYYTSWLRMTLR